ncbi:MAG: hypothetical protein QOJ03_409 [Frankiaceae bacterium]|jgi:hypothetical protein|nr:hypothetical protein [Frankiaceae bacterium]
MARHALTHQRAHGGRTATVISAGTLLLCLWSTGTALADSGTSPLALHSSTTPAPGVPDPIGTVAKVVHDLTGPAGVADPLASEPTNPRVHQPARHPRHHRIASTPQTPARHPELARHQDVRPTATSPVAGLGQLRLPTDETRALVTTAMSPTVAGDVHHAVLATAGSQLRALVPSSDDLQAGRALLFGLGILTIGCLAGGHIKAAQDALLAQRTGLS